MNVNWGKPTIVVQDLEATNAGWKKLPTPVQDSTEMQTEEGETVEAPVEGGELEDVYVKRSKYKLVLRIRKTKNRVMPIPASDGVVVHNYKVALQPEDADCYGFQIDKSRVSVKDVYTAKEGAMWEYTFAALKPESGDSVKWGIVAIDASSNVPTLTPVEEG